MPVQTISITGGWMPDLNPYEMPDGGCQLADNILPLKRGMAGSPNFNIYSGTMGDNVPPPLTAREFYHSNGSCYVIVCFTDKIWRVNPNATVTDLTPSGTTYGATQWSLAQYGDWVVATNGVDNVQVCKDFASATAFQDLAGTPPKAKQCCMYKGRLILGNLTSPTVAPRQVQWSERWTPKFGQSCKV